MDTLVIAMQALVATSVYFVWVVRYDNIVEEFKHYELPDWVRDLVGILKMTFALLLLIGIWRGEFAVAGGVGIALLMTCAVFTHIRVKNPVHKMLPALCLLAISVAIAVLNGQLLSA